MNKKILALFCVLVFMFSTLNVGAATFAVFKPNAEETVVIQKATSADIVENIQASNEKPVFRTNTQTVFNNPRTISYAPVTFNPIDYRNGDTDEESNSEELPDTQNSGLSIIQQPLTFQTNMLRFVSIDISSPQVVGEPFTITVTAADSDDNVTAITLGRPPYTSQSDWEPQQCSPAAPVCTKTWTITENAAGEYEYKVKAKNSLNQVISQTLDVTVNEEATTDSFIFRTAAIDGALFDQTSQVSYVDSTVRIFDPTEGDDYIEQEGEPFATFDVLSNRVLEVQYTAEAFMADTDFLYFDENLPNCAGNECTFSSQIWETTCTYIAVNDNYDCTLVNTEYNDAIRFTYTPFGDSLGNNVIRFLNGLYRVGAPILNLESLDTITFQEGTSHTTSFKLVDFVYYDGDKDSLSWDVSANFMDVVINNDTSLTITPTQSDFVGNDVLTVTVSDGTNSDSDVLYVTVSESVNHFPSIDSFSPDSPVDVLEGQNQLFTITVSDPDNDPLEVIWLLDSAVAAVNRLDYTYTAPSVDAPEVHIVSVTVSDDNDNYVSMDWTVNVLPDTDAPQVENLACVPGTQTQGLTVVCSATVTDDVGVTSVDLEVTYPDNVQNTFAMANTGGDIYSLDFTDTLQTGIYDVRLVAEDVEGNVNNAETSLFIIEPVPGSGNTTTVITTPQDNQDFAVAEEFDVNATITAFGSVTNCSATITFDNNVLGLSDSATINIGDMTNTSTEVSWKLSADNLGTSDITVTTVCNEGSSSHDIVVNIGILTETNPPSVVDVTAVPDPQTQGGLVTISANVTDDSAVDTVDVSVTFPNSATSVFSMSNVGGDIFSFDLNDTLQTGTYTATIIASDVFGNLNDTESVQFVVDAVPSSGNSTTVITTPNDGAVFNVSESFDVNATVSAVGGFLTACESTITFDSTMFTLLSASDTIVLGDMVDGQSHELSWQLLAENEGVDNIRVDTICAEGSSSYDIVVNVSVVSPQDTENPVVLDVAAVPTTQEQGLEVVISANITDNVAVDHADVRITYPDLTENSFAMSNIGDVYYYSFNDTIQTGVYTATIVAVDTSNNVNDTESVQFTITPASGAGNSTTEITTPVDNEQVLINTSVEVNATVTAVGTITDCDVTLSIAGTSLVLTSAGTVNIPSLTDGSAVVSWQLNATELGSSDLTANTVCTAGSSSSDTVLNVQVVDQLGDLTNPVVVDVTAVPDPADQNDTV
ncbi:hypothetical protein KY339_02275, partial [Candidatus Woesearchaeota archaeon]|nr:hypothetical protein [Candidatus Woesearchaeota archaeon]